MDKRQLVLHAERDLLECQLVMLERLTEERRQAADGAPETAACMEALFTRLRLVNDLLAEMRSPEAST